MLKIINDIEPFFEDCYRKISVREYARLTKISPPTASKMLEFYKTENILVSSRFRNYLFYKADSDSKDFADLSRIYWRHRLADLTEFLCGHAVSPVIVLFGSLSKAEARKESDIDIAVFSVSKNIDVLAFEKKLGRKIQTFWFGSLKSVKNEELLNNIRNGYILEGGF